MSESHHHEDGSRQEYHVRRTPVPERIQFLASPEAKARYRRAASLEGRSLSDWLRKVADAAAPVHPDETALATREDLESFFEGTDHWERWASSQHRVSR